MANCSGFKSRDNRLLRKERWIKGIEEISGGFKAFLEAFAQLRTGWGAPRHTMRTGIKKAYSLFAKPIPR
jgi:hypothetical protein